MERNVNRLGRESFRAVGGQGRAWVWIGMEYVEPLYEEYKARGVKILLPPTNFPWALEMQIEDPDGNVLRIGSEPEADMPFAR